MGWWRSDITDIAQTAVSNLHYDICLLASDKNNAICTKDEFLSIKLAAKASNSPSDQYKPYLSISTQLRHLELPSQTVF